MPIDLAALGCLYSMVSTVASPPVPHLQCHYVYIKRKFGHNYFNFKRIRPRSSLVIFTRIVHSQRPENSKKIINRAIFSPKQFAPFRSNGYFFLANKNCLTWHY